MSHTNSFAFVTLVACVVSAALAPSARAEGVKLVGPITAEAEFNGDLAATEKELKRQARRKAIEEGVGLAISSNSIVRNFELVADEITTEAKGVISEEQWGPITDGPTGSTKKITLTAKVSKDLADLERATCTIIKAKHDPKVALVFVEKIGDQDKWTTERGLVEAMFTEAFIGSCFTVVESGVKVSEISATGDLPQATINEIIKNANADYVVLGQGKVIKSNATELLGDSGMNSYSVSASLKLINASSNVVEAVATKSVQVLGISPEVALSLKVSQKRTSQVVNGIMDELIDNVAARWSSELVNAAPVQVVVEAVPNFASALAFRTLVEKTLKISVKEPTVTGGRALFTIAVEGGAGTLASSLEGKKAGKYTVEVLEVSQGKVVLKLN
jgi:hypothetical protein